MHKCLPLYSLHPMYDYDKESDKDCQVQVAHWIFPDYEGTSGCTVQCKGPMHSPLEQPGIPSSKELHAANTGL